MGKTRTAIISGEPETNQEKKAKKRGPKKSLKEQKGVRIPGLKGGERVVAVTAELPPAKEEKEEKKADLKKAAKPKIRGKKYQAARALVDKTKFYSLKEAVKLLKKTSYSSFVGTVELHLVVKKKGITFNVELPHSTGREKKIEIANEKTIEKLKKGKIDFDILLSTPEMMPHLVPFAKVLGPKGLMPNPKNGTLIKDIKEAKKFSVKKITIKTERKAPLIHLAVAKLNQKDKEIIENIEAVLTSVGKRRIQKAYLSATMGPSVKLALA